MKDSSAATASRYAIQRAPMLQTLLWLASTPLTIPTWLLLIAWSNIISALQKIFKAFYSLLFGARSAKRAAATQTDLRMAQLDSFMELFDLNQEAMAEMVKEQQLERTRLQQQRELKPTDDYVALLKQRILELENRNAALQGALTDVVLPTLDQLVCDAEALGSTGVSSTVQHPSFPAPLLEALLRARQVLVDTGVDSAPCSSVEASPAQKTLEQRWATKWLSPESAPSTCSKNPLSPRLHDMTGVTSTAAKALDFGTTRPTAVLHVLTHDI